MKPDVHYVRNEGVALAYQLIGDGPADLFVAIGYLTQSSRRRAGSGPRRRGPPMR
jgi:hypothetical protein